MDTKYFHQALEEWMDADPTYRRALKAINLPMRDLSNILKRAQELKDYDHARNT